MSISHITVVRSGLPRPEPAANELVMSDDELRGWMLNGGIATRVGRFDVARLLTERLATSGRPMLAWALRLMSRGDCYIEDAEGGRRDITIGLLWRWSWQVIREAAGRRALLGHVERQVETAARAARARTELEWDRSAPPIYLRTDLSFSVRAGGSVGHIAGVLNELANQPASPILMTTAPIPTLRADVETHIIAVPERFWNFRELPALFLNDVVFDDALGVCAGRRIALVYQRYSLDNYAGLRLAQHFRVPFIVEYNGSEIWMSRHWSRPLKYEPLAERIELLNLRSADLVVVVSRAMRDELVARGVSGDRILVNPNAVDPDRYAPAVDGSEVRRRLGLNDDVVVLGFISTFQPWHGAVVLARAFVELLTRHPECRRSVRLLMIGAGAQAEAAHQVVADAGLADAVRFTGLVAQEDGPRYLAACDILVSPHVPNADGSPFFGSPTKLFEYMAMGRGIVASDLDQIGEVLRHGETAWLVPPADVHALAEGMARLAGDANLRRQLGTAARREVLAHYTWRAHVGRTLDALATRVHASAA